MRVTIITFVTAAVLGTAGNAAIVGAPTGVDNPLAIELAGTTESSDNKKNDAGLAVRDKDPLACDGWCWGASDQVHCCLIAGIYSRCHYIGTPCSALSFPDALSAPVPHPLVEETTTTATPRNVTALPTLAIRDADTTTTVTVTSTSLATTITRTVYLASSDISTAGLTTTQVVSTTATTVVPITVSTVPTPITNTTTTNATMSSSSYNYTSTSYTHDPLTNSSSSGSSSTSSYSPIITRSSAARSTLTSLEVLTSGTTTASLNDAPSAIASDLGSGRSGAASVVDEYLGGAAALMVLALGVVGAVAVLL